VSRDLSPNLALAASVDLRQAEGQTYLLELHEMRKLPRLVAQAFTDDTSAYGGALLQRQEFGGTRTSSDLDLPRISKLVVDPPSGVSRRGMKRALALEKGDRFDPQQRFVAEVELVDYLMDRGYPDARVSVRTVTEGRRDQKVRLEVDVQPGPHVDFRFEGEKIAKPLRALIRSLYRPDFFEPESIEEMRAETVRALRSRGFLEPTVEISVEPVDSGAPQGDRIVVVSMTGGVKMSLEAPDFVGIPAPDAEVLRVVFANAVQRVELGVGLPSADRRLIRALADLGYPRAAIVTRYQSLETGVLTVELEPGPRQHITTVEITGVDEESLPGIATADLKALLAVAEGDPLRRIRLSRSALAVERDLASRGYLDARVRTILGADGGDDEYATAVTFVVESGTQSRLGEIEFTGLRSTRERWARKVTALEPDESLARDDLSRARTNLWRTGLFSGVSAETVESEPGVKRVVFDLAERSRYRLTYGVRWDSGDGMGAVVDATDDNFLGRSWSLGLRALYSNEENSLRWLTRVPRAFGGPGSLEFFAAVRELATTVFLGPIFGTVDVPIDRLEWTLQYSHPVSETSTFRTYVRYSDEKQTFPFTSLQIRNPQLGVQYVYDSRGPEPLTERGIFASVDLSGSKEFLGGDLSYARMYSQFNLYRPAGRALGKKLSWSQSFRLGLTETFDQVLINSRDVRFFAGGEYSVRGYETESLGPLGDFGPTGGGALFVVNQELRWRGLADYALVLFADAGNVWEDSGDLLSDLVTSAGIGVRAQTPVGLLRLDIARPLDQRIGIDPHYKIYFGIGTTF
ncbi:MAG: BamA/TamA family outer membrane protein, partial [Acidobacteriota bacterium]|nr:BamA/TamA family outer membrane protein [Acidobacteriota bacterium]